MIDFVENGNALTFTVRVVPRASRSGIAGEVDGQLKIRISAPPVDGAANDELIRVLAKHFGVAKSSVEILKGQGSRIKRIRIDGASAEKLKTLNAN